jgi:hypothetical protein
MDLKSKFDVGFAFLNYIQCHLVMLNFHWLSQWQLVLDQPLKDKYFLNSQIFLPIFNNVYLGKVKLLSQENLTMKDLEQNGSAYMYTVIK